MSSSNPKPITTLSPSCESPLPMSHASCRQDELFVPIRGGDIHCPCACHADRDEEPNAYWVRLGERSLQRQAAADWRRMEGQPDAEAWDAQYKEVEEDGFINRAITYRSFFIDSGVPGFERYVQVRNDVNDLLAQAEGAYMADVKNRDDDREQVEITPGDVGSLEVRPGDMGRFVIQPPGHVKTAFGVWVETGSRAHIRGEADEAFAIHWEDADVVIPWPEGMTVKEAIMTWADEQRKE